MSVRISWVASNDANIASYDVERAVSVGGPWSLLLNVPHNFTGPNYDSLSGEFFYVDSAGTQAVYYRLTAIDSLGQRSQPSAPFRAAQTGEVSFSAALVAELLIPAGNADALLALGYTTIEIWKSTDFGNSYQEITGASPQSAHLHASTPNTKYYLKDAVLAFEIDGVQTPDIVFGPTPEYYSTAMAVAKINAVVPNLASIGSGTGELVVSSPSVGRTSTVQIVKMSMASTLGFPTSRVVGIDPRVPLVSGNPIYFYYDSDPAELHAHSDGLSVPRAATRYKWRFSANGSKPFSNFSESVYDNASRLGVDPASLSVGVAVFVTPDGRGQRKSVLVSASTVQKIGGVLLSPDVTSIVQADETGFIQIPLVRGMKVTLAIEGTSLVRDITVPDSPTFDILQALTDAPDQFTVQTTAPLLTRRSL